jgi:hypothetical protein
VIIRSVCVRGSGQISPRCGSSKGRIVKGTYDARKLYGDVEAGGRAYLVLSMCRVMQPSFLRIAVVIIHHQAVCGSGFGHNVQGRIVQETEKRRGRYIRRHVRMASVFQRTERGFLKNSALPEVEPRFGPWLLLLKY